MPIKPFLVSLLLLLPFSLQAQDNTWEQGDEEATTVETKTGVDAKYLKGAVPEVDGRVVFSRTFDAPGKSAAEIYQIVLGYMQRITRGKNQINSQVALMDSVRHELGGNYEEWLVFKKLPLSLDRTRFYYTLRAECADGKATISMSRIRYFYDEERNPQRMNAEEWITDATAVNKKNTRLYPGSGKFRRKTIDRKDFLFNKFESLLK